MNHKISEKLIRPNIQSPFIRNEKSDVSLLEERMKLSTSITKALQIRLAFYGEKHPHVAITYTHIGGSLQTLGEGNKALDFYKKSLAIQLDFYGEYHNFYRANLSQHRNDIPRPWGNKRSPPSILRNSFRSKAAFHGGKHPQVATTYNTIGIVLKTRGKTSETLESHTKALFILFSLR